MVNIEQNTTGDTNSQTQDSSQNNQENSAQANQQEGAQANQQNQATQQPQGSEQNQTNQQTSQQNNAGDQSSKPNPQSKGGAVEKKIFELILIKIKALHEDLNSRMESIEKETKNSTQLAKDAQKKADSYDKQINQIKDQMKKMLSLYELVSKEYNPFISDGKSQNEINNKIDESKDVAQTKSQENPTSEAKVETKVAQESANNASSEKETANENKISANASSNTNPSTLTNFSQEGNQSNGAANNNAAGNNIGNGDAIQGGVSQNQTLSQNQVKQNNSNQSPLQQNASHPVQPSTQPSVQSPTQPHFQSPAQLPAQSQVQPQINSHSQTHVQTNFESQPMTQNQNQQGMLNRPQAREEMPISIDLYSTNNTNEQLQNRNFQNNQNAQHYDQNYDPGMNIVQNQNNNHNNNQVLSNVQSQNNRSNFQEINIHDSISDTETKTIIPNSNVSEQEFINPLMNKLHGNGNEIITNSDETIAKSNSQIYGVQNILEEKREGAENSNIIPGHIESPVAAPSPFSTPELNNINDDRINKTHARLANIVLQLADIAEKKNISHKIPVILRKTNLQNSFILENGEKIDSVSSLLGFLIQADEKRFSNYVDLQKNDFQNWITNSLNEKSLGSQITPGMTQNEMSNLIINHLANIDINQFESLILDD